MRSSAVWRVLALAGVMESAGFGAAWAQEHISQYDIPAGDLAGALRAFGEQSDANVLFDPADAAQLRSPGLHGQYERDQALALLLENSGLRFRFQNGTVVVADDLGPSASPSQLGDAGEAAPSERTAESEEIVVTGTYIRGQPPVGVSVITIGQEEIERSGAATIQEVVRQLPQNYRGGVSEEFGTGREAETDTVDGNALNLRGLGSNATLVLVNGRRLATTGETGIFTDISNIPLSAVERIEVLLDGASALYGSDAVGGVVNIILRKDYVGAETRLRAGASTEGNAQEYQLAQSFGAGWSTGNSLISYEYYERDSVFKRNRERSASCDLTRFGGDNFCNMFSNPGTIFAGLDTYAIPRGQDGTSLTPDDFVAGTVNFSNPNAFETLLPRQRRHSLSAFVSQSAGDRLTLEGAALISLRESLREGAAPEEFLAVTDINPFYVNPAGGTDPIFIAYSFQDDFGPTITTTEINSYSATLTARYEPSDAWLVTADATYERNESERLVDGLVKRDEFLQPLVFQALLDPDPATAFNPFGDGSHTNPATIAAIRGAGAFTGESDLWTTRAVAEGPVLRLPGGDVRLAVGAEHRRQDFISTGQAPIEGAAGLFVQEYDRDISAVFAELRIPLVDPDDGLPGLHRLNVSLAGRYENYSDFGETANPKIGVEWAPLEGFMVRGSWGTSFKAPDVLDLDETSNLTFIFPIPDPLSDTGFSDALIWTGGNADLREETATTWNIGFEIAPPSKPNWRLAATYFDIDFDNRIEFLLDPFSALLDPLFADAVIRDPTPEQRAEACARSTFDGALDDCLNFPVAALVDARISNTAILRNRGLDLLGAFDVETENGTFTFNLNATYLFEYSRALRSTSSLSDFLDTPLNPLDFKLRGSLAWERGGFEATFFINYFDGYRDTTSEPDRKIASWTTFDLAASYDLPLRDPSPLSGVEFAFNVQNLFDEDPPFYNNPNRVGYDPVNATLLGRFVSFQIRKSW